MKVSLYTSILTYAPNNTFRRCFDVWSKCTWIISKGIVPIIFHTCTTNYIQIDIEYEKKNWWDVYETEQLKISNKLFVIQIFSLLCLTFKVQLSLYVGPQANSLNLIFRITIRFYTHIINMDRIHLHGLLSNDNLVFPPNFKILGWCSKTE